MRSAMTARHWSRSTPPATNCLCRPLTSQINGFTLYATRTILSGGGEELVELARTNLRQLEAE